MPMTYIYGQPVNSAGWPITAPEWVRDHPDDPNQEPMFLGRFQFIDEATGLPFTDYRGEPRTEWFLKEEWK